MAEIKRMISRLLRETADKIDAGTCNLTEDEAAAVFEIFGHVAMSKEKTCVYLHVSRSTFDTYVRSGIMPKGRKRVGFKELTWYKDEIDAAVKLMRK